MSLKIINFGLFLGVSLSCLSMYAGSNRVPSEPLCKDKIKLCIYSPANIGGGSVDEFSRRALRTLNGNDSEFIQNGWVSVDNNGVINYWFDTLTQRDLYGEILKEMDQLVPENTLAKPQVILEFTHVLIESKGFNDFNFGLGITYSPLSLISPVAPRAQSTTNTETGGSGLNVAFGNLTSLMINLKLDMARTKYLAKVDQEVPFSRFHGEDLNYSDVTMIYPKDLNSVGQNIKGDKGLKLSGVVQISTGDQPMVIIKNFSMTLGLPAMGPETPGNISTVRTISTGPRRVELSPGIPHIVGLSSTTVDKKSIQKGLLSYADNDDSIQVKTFVIVTARITEHESKQLLESKKLSKDVAELPKLSLEDSKSLPNRDSRGTEGALAEIFASAAPIQPIENDSSSQFSKAPAIKLDQRLLTQKNFDQTLRVRFKNLRNGNDLMSSNGIRVDQFALGKIYLPPVDFAKDCLTDEVDHCSIIRYGVTIETVETDSQKKPLAQYSFGITYYPFNNEIRRDAETVPVEKPKTKNFLGFEMSNSN